MSNIKRLDASRSNFNEELDNLLSRESDTGADVQQTVASIIEDVRQRGDAALCEYTQKFDRWSCMPANIEIPKARMEEAWG